MVCYKKIDIRDTLEISEFIEYLTNVRFPYKDVFTLNKPTKIATHIHDDCEARLFIQGSATFIIEGEVYECSPGSYIEIDPGVKHSFEFNGDVELKVVRFFSKEQKWVANFCAD